MLALPLLAAFLLFHDADVEQVLARLGEVKTSTQSEAFVLTEDQINRFVAGKIQASKTEGLRSLRFTFSRRGRFRAEATLDMDKVKVEAFPFSAVSRLLNGRQTIRLDGCLQINEAKARVEVESARITGVWIPAWLMSAILAGVCKRQPPYIDVTEGFPLPYGIDEVNISAGKVEIVR